MRQHPELKEAWEKSGANEFGRLAQGIGGRIKGKILSYLSKKKTYQKRDEKIARMANSYAM